MVFTVFLLLTRWLAFRKGMLTGEVNCNRAKKNMQREWGEEVRGLYPSLLNQMGWGVQRRRKSGNSESFGPVDCWEDTLTTPHMKREQTKQG